MRVWITKATKQGEKRENVSLQQAVGLSFAFFAFAPFAFALFASAFFAPAPFAFAPFVFTLFASAFFVFALSRSKRFPGRTAGPTLPGYDSL